MNIKGKETIDVLRIKELEKDPIIREWLDIRYPKAEYEIYELLRVMTVDVSKILMINTVDIHGLDSNIRLMKRLPTIDLMYRIILSIDNITRDDESILYLFELLYIQRETSIIKKLDEFLLYCSIDVNRLYDILMNRNHEINDKYNMDLRIEVHRIHLIRTGKAKSSDFIIRRR